MSALTAAEIARRAGGRVDGDANALADAWAFDSRALEAGSCFVALRGNRDGHDFVRAAFDAGAAVALVSRSSGYTPVAGRALVVVDDTLTALQQVAQSLRADRPGLNVVAVAGSTGKTSTKDLLAATLAPAGCHANAESYNNEFGLPITLCNAPAAANVVVTEMGERIPGDLARLCEIARPDTGVVTNVGLAHAEFLGGHEGTVAILSELLAALPASGTAVLNGDDPFERELAGATKARVLRVGHKRDTDLRIEHVSVDEALRPTVTIDGYDFHIPLRGAHHATNAALAIAVGHRVFGLSFEDIALELEAVAPARWRMELLETDDGIAILNDAYNANPTSMEAALVALAHLSRPSGSRRIAVLGDMRELGVHHDDAHRIVGTRAAELGCDLVVGVGGGGRAIAVAAADAGAAVATVADAIGAIEELAAELRPGDAVLVKGSRALGLERVASELLAAGRRRVQGGAA